MDDMTSRHLYKHVATGVVQSLPDSFAAVFGDRLERVDEPQKKAVDSKTNAEEGSVAVTETANPANTADAPKEGTK